MEGSAAVARGERARVGSARAGAAKATAAGRNGAVAARWLLGLGVFAGRASGGCARRFRPSAARALAPFAEPRGLARGREARGQARQSERLLARSTGPCDRDGRPAIGVFSTFGGPVRSITVLTLAMG